MCNDCAGAVIALAHLEQFCQFRAGLVRAEHINSGPKERLERVKDDHLCIYLLDSCLYLRAIESQACCLGDEVTLVQIAPVSLDSATQDGQIIFYR